MSAKKVCSFCGRSEREVPLMITGMNGFICSDCAQQAYRIVMDALPSEKKNDDLGFKLSDLPKPKDIKAYLDEYVIGQDERRLVMSARMWKVFFHVFYKSQTTMSRLPSEGLSSLMR